MMRGLLALLFCVALYAPASAADNYPTRPIKLLIPFPPAGITDLSGRIVAEALRAKLGQPVVVENKPGANGVLGLRELLKAVPRDVTVIMIEHDMDTALDLADRITLLHFGEVIVEGTRAEVVADPRTREVYLGE